NHKSPPTGYLRLAATQSSASSASSAVFFICAGNQPQRTLRTLRSSQIASEQPASTRPRPSVRLNSICLECFFFFRRQPTEQRLSSRQPSNSVSTSLPPLNSPARYSAQT